MIPEYEQCLTGCDQNDWKLKTLIKEKFIFPPKFHSYNFDSNPPFITGEIGQPTVVDKILKRKRNGFFIECGAFDGEDFSNSLFFELHRNWTGLLIEVHHD